VVDAGVVYLCTGTGRSLLAAELASGTPLWETSLGALAFGRPALTAQTAWVSDVDGRLTAIARSNGAVNWQQRIDESYLSEPVIADGRLVVGTGSGRLILLESDTAATPPPAPSSLRVAPNPSAGIVLISAGAPDTDGDAAAGLIEVFDVLGRRHASLPLAGGEIEWDGTDRNGRRVPAGVYLLRLHTPAGVRTAKLQIVR
jgi:outer membrane protein assembly factor BamB